MHEITYLEGIKRGIEKSMREHDEVVLFGQDVGAFGGAFKVTLGLQEEFGSDRVFDTPICESAMVGAAIGMATQGLRPILEFQFADFGMTAFHQILNNAATVHYRTGRAVPLVLRAPCGADSEVGRFIPKNWKRSSRTSRGSRSFTPPTPQMPPACCMPR